MVIYFLVLVRTSAASLYHRHNSELNWHLVHVLPDFFRFRFFCNSFSTYCIDIYGYLILFTLCSCVFLFSKCYKPKPNPPTTDVYRINTYRLWNSWTLLVSAESDRLLTRIGLHSRARLFWRDVLCELFCLFHMFLLRSAHFCCETQLLPVSDAPSSSPPPQLIRVVFKPLCLCFMDSVVIKLLTLHLLSDQCQASLYPESTSSSGASDVV